MVRVCLVLALVSLLVVFHCCGYSLLPERSQVIPANAMQPLDANGSAAWVYAFAESESNLPHNPYSRVRLFENGKPLIIQTAVRRDMFPVRSGIWAHIPGAIIFSATDNTDPRKNGRTYTLRFPPFRSGTLGGLAAMVFIVATAALYRLTRARPAPVAASSLARAGAWRLHLALICLVFMAGLYCSTGTLTPYALTYVPHVDGSTGYLYSVDHGLFRSLYDFVNGSDRSHWDQAVLLRRILYPALAWPFMRVWGFEAGGVIASLFYNGVGLLAALWLLRRQVGERGAIFAGWLLALYPGAAYWAGLPYIYALIFPCCLLLMNGLVALSGSISLRRIALVSLGMGVAYLAYDLVFFFLPASLLVLGWQRRWREVVTSAVLQVLPLLFWGAILRLGFGQPAVNSNTSIFSTVLGAYLHPRGAAAWQELAAQVPIAGWHVWFGANFLFLPALFLGIVVLNAVSSRLRTSPAETALLAATAALFLFTNLAPPYVSEWNMRGAWISRLYQPVFPALVFFAARWWQALPPLRLPLRLLVSAGVLGALLGNALVVFGPILRDPGHVSEQAFYAFYTHTDTLLVHPYEKNLDKYGRHPFGFPALPGGKSVR